MEHYLTEILMASIITGLAYGIFWVAREKNAVRSIFKTLPVLILAIAAFASGAPTLLFIALILSAAGDAFLSRDGETMFLAGLGSFLAAHLAFVALFLQFPSTGVLPGWMLITVILITTLVIGLVLTNLWKHLGDMKVAVVVYTLIIGAMNVSAWGTGQSLLLLTGVTMFVFSDMVLAHELFYWKNPMIKKVAAYVVWFSYFAAQATITISYL